MPVSFTFSLLDDLDNFLADPKRPAALILGFGGAKPKHIEKYVELYHKQGIGAISYTGTNFWDDIPAPSEGLPFAPLFHHPQHRKRALILHVASMNGFRQLLRLYRYLDGEGETTHRFMGGVFDSCPATLTTKLLAYGRAVCDIGRNNDPHGLRYLPQALWTTAKYSLLKHMNPNKLNELQMYYYVTRWVMLPHNQLFIYSEVDKLINYRDVEEFADRQKGKGNCVKLEKFPNSPHVQHIRSDPQRYEKTVRELIKKSL